MGEQPVKRAALLAAILIPLAGLAHLVYSYQTTLARGTTVTFPIRGYDPRDILAGHYLTYQIDYGVQPPSCEKEKPICFCIEDRSSTPPRGHFEDCASSSCKTAIRGICRYSAFTAGIERWYLTEAKAVEIRAAPGDKVVVAVGPDGQALVKDFIRSRSNQ